jgi:hypothetical protein
MRRLIFGGIFLSLFLLIGTMNPAKVRADCTCEVNADDVCVVVKVNNCNANEVPVCQSGGTASGGCRANTCVCRNESKTVFCSVAGGEGIDTAIGCVPVDREGFVNWLLTRLFGIIGGIAFILMVGGGIQIATSSGDPQKVKAGQETVSSALAGLLFALFSLFILRLVMVDILHIPGIN